MVDTSVKYDQVILLSRLERRELIVLHNLQQHITTA
jgi:hypothetical protein